MEGMDRDSGAASPAPVAAPPPDVQRARIKELMDAPMKEGQVWYVLCAKWWQLWKAYTCYGEGAETVCEERVAGLTLDEDISPEPGPIDNSSLARPDDTDQICPGMTDDDDYVVVPSTAYHLLEEWYNSNGPANRRGPNFPRVVIRTGVHEELMVEVFPRRCKVYRCRPDGTPDTASIVVHTTSRVKTVAQVQSKRGRLLVLAVYNDVLNLLAIPIDSAVQPRLSLKILASEPLDTHDDPSGDFVQANGPVADAERPASVAMEVAVGGNGTAGSACVEGERDSPEGYAVAFGGNGMLVQAVGGDGGIASTGSAAGDGDKSLSMRGGPGKVSGGTDGADIMDQDGEGIASTGAGRDSSTGGSGEDEAGAGKGEPDGWEVLVNGVQYEGSPMTKTLDQVVPGVQTLELLVETKETPDDAFPRDHIVNKWRYDLRVGDWVDARDTDKVWFEGRVVEEDVGGDPMRIKVHFRGWSVKWDQDMSRLTVDIQPLHSVTQDWIKGLAEGDGLELRGIGPKQTVSWFNATVVEMDRAGKRMRVKPDATYEGEIPHEDWIQLDSDDVCAKGTHIKEKAPGRRLGGGGSSAYSYSPLARQPTKGKPPVVGAVGLDNLGNTCFMNSMVQCLMAVRPLTRFFTSRAYAKDLNEDNPLGAGGAMARAYAALVGEMWGGEYTSVAPQELKKVISQQAPQFAGYQQHDSSELMSFLLDGLHEDLNRVRSKPYVETVESAGRPDPLVAQESWRRYLMRNDSIVVDKCSGLLRSHVMCPGCSNESVTFDPYLSLTLPLPVDNVRKVDLLLQRLPYGRRPLRMTCTVPADANVQAVKEWVCRTLNPSSGNSDSMAQGVARAEEHGQGQGEASSEEEQTLTPDRLVVLQSYHNAVSKTVGSNTCVSDIKQLNNGDMLLVYQLEHPLPSSSSHASHSNSAAFPGQGRTLGGGQAVGSQSMSQEANDKAGSTAVPADVEGAERVCVVDILWAKPPKASGTSYMSSKQTDLFSWPLRVTHRLNATNADIYAVVGKHLARFLRGGKGAGVGVSSIKEDAEGESALSGTGDGAEVAVGGAAVVVSMTAGEQSDSVLDSEYVHIKADEDGTGASEDPAAPLPYKLFITNAHGYSIGSKKEVPMDDKPFKGTTHSQAVTVEFKADGYRLLDEQEAEARDMHVSVEAAKRVREHHTLDDCFKKFKEREQLGEKNPWYCNKCKVHQQAFKKMDVYTAPDVLIVHLKRFQYSPGQHFVHRQKVDDFVDFPIHGLDLTSYIQEAGGPIFEQARPLYDLFAVSEHSGCLRAGHYTAMACNAEDKKWYKLNDSFISESDASKAVTSMAYVLFYQRRHGSLRWAGMGQTGQSGTLA